MVCSSVEYYLYRRWNQFDIHVFLGADGSLFYIFELLTLSSLQSYLVDTYLYVSNLLRIFLTFYVIYSTYSASAFAVNTLIRSAVAASFPLFTVQLFTNVSGWGFFLVFDSMLIVLISVIVGSKLGVHFAWLHRTFVLAISFFVLQIRIQNTGAQ